MLQHSEAQCEDIITAKAEIANLKRSDFEQWETIHKIEEFMRRQIPVWVALMMTLMGSITGATIAWAGTMMHFTGK